MTEGEEGFLAGIFESHATIVVRRTRKGKAVCPKLQLCLSGLPPHLATWILEKCPGTRLHSNARHSRVLFVTPEDGAKFLAKAYGRLISLKEQAQVFFRYAKLQGRPGIRMSSEARREREELAEKIIAYRQGA